ncbi:hypothetical protein [Campylobacter devanensis]|uniref:hypothetical protein n=1 Tax=Campylobacter devanensis TaxID=3161138 RepID=UPI000A346599|nr:hypothetical protein [Campylobacter sp. P0209]
MSKILFLPFVNSFILELTVMLILVIAALDYANLLIIALGIFNVIVYTLLSFILIFCNIEFPRCAKKDDILKIGKKMFLHNLLLIFSMLIIFCINCVLLLDVTEYSVFVDDTNQFIFFLLSILIVFHLCLLLICHAESKAIGDPCPNCGLYNSASLVESNILDIHLGSANFAYHAEEDPDIITSEETYMCDNCKNKWRKKEVNRYRTYYVDTHVLETHYNIK